MLGRIILLSGIFQLFIHIVQGQPDVYVDKSTGGLRVHVPIYAMSEGEISAGISLSYVNGSGVPVSTADGEVGLGWHLNAGGSVKRELRGLPDDYTATGDDRKGWLATESGQLIAAKIGGISFTGDESANWSALQTLMNSSGELIYDTEPDLFSVSAPGLSCQFVFDHTGTPQPLPLSDIEITVHRNSSGHITSFTVTDGSGTSYYFTGRIESTRSATKVSLQPLEFQKTSYHYYKTPLTYTREWRLSRITSYYGKSLYFSYEPETPKTTEQKVSVWLRQPVSHESYVEKHEYTLKETYTDQRLISLYSIGKELAVLTYQDDKLKTVEVRDHRREETPYVKTIEFTYESITSAVDGTRRTVLGRVQEYSGCDRMPAYEFAYHGVENLPGPTSPNVDYWGYYNNRTLYSGQPPKLVVFPDEAPGNKVQLYRDITTAGQTSYTLQGSDRRPSGSYTAFGILQQVKMPLGDLIRVEYESNTYHDNFYEQEVTGPGVRVKRLFRTDKRTSSTKTGETINYYYTHDTSSPSSGATSGHLLHEPRFAFTLQAYTYNSTSYTYQDLSSGSFSDRQKWEYLTARSTEDLGHSGQQVLYSSIIKKTASENGFTQTISTLPPGEHQQAPIWEDWSMPEVQWARNTTTGCTVASDIGTGTNTYPYIPHSSSGGESLLFSHEIIYDGNGRKLRETENQYGHQALGSTAVTGLYVEGVPFSCSAGSYLFGTYTLTSNTFYPLRQTLTRNFEYEGATPHTMQSTRDEYQRTSPWHPYVTTTVSTLADGSRFKATHIYPEDYTLSGSPAGTAGNALETLVLTHRVSTPVESVSSQQLPGQSGYQVTGATYTSYQNVREKIVSHQASVFDPGYPVSDFQYSNATAGSLSPDSRYELLVEVTVDDQYRKTVSYSPKSRNFQSTLWGNINEVPVLEATNAHPQELFYTDFTNLLHEENLKTNSLVLDVKTALKEGRNDAHSLRISSKVVASVSGKIEKGHNEYFISFWSHNTSEENLKVEFSNTAGGTPVKTVNFALSGAGHWQYHRQQVDLSSLNNTVYFTFSRGAVSNIASEFTIDDLLLYPVGSSISTTSYTFPFGASSVTNGNGQSGQTHYDALGRVTGIYDAQGNLLQAYKYQYADLAGEKFEGLTLSHGPIYEGEATTYQTREFCRDNVTYRWAFMESGATPQESDYITDGYQASHTFSSAGTKTVYIRASHPDFADLEYSRTVTVEKHPITVSACSKGQLSYDLCQEHDFLTIDCGEISETPANALEVLLKVTGVTNGDGSYTYQWQRRDAGTVQWINMPVTTPLLRECSQENADYRCIVTDGSGRKGESQLFTLKRYRSNPECQVQVPSCN